MGASRAPRWCRVLSVVSLLSLVLVMCSLSLDHRDAALSFLRAYRQQTTSQQADFKSEAARYDKIEAEVQVSAVNRTRGEARLLVYNRVPKCGSTTMKTLLARLADKNGFRHQSATVYGQRHLSPEEEQVWVSEQMSRQRRSGQPVSIDRHVFFVNFTKYGEPPPIYINMLRAPVEAFVSSFYYVRSPQRWKRLLNDQRSMHPYDLQRLLKYQREIYPRSNDTSKAGVLELPSYTWLNKTLAECVLGNHDECSSNNETFVAFLCGSQPECSEARSAIQIAKFNVETQYAVVGVMEHWNESLLVMEHYVPLYLAGISRSYSKMGRSRKVNKTPHPTPSPEVRSEIKRTLKADIEIYEFARQRLLVQLSAVNTTPSPLTTTDEASLHS